MIAAEAEESEDSAAPLAKKIQLAVLPIKPVSTTSFSAPSHHDCGD